MSLDFFFLISAMIAFLLNVIGPHYVVLTGLEPGLIIKMSLNSQKSMCLYFCLQSAGVKDPLAWLQSDCKIFILLIFRKYIYAYASMGGDMQRL